MAKPESELREVIDELRELNETMTKIRNDLHALRCLTVRSIGFDPCDEDDEDDVSADAISWSG